MDDEAAKALARKMNHRDVSCTLGTSLCILVPALIFLCTMRSEFELAAEPSKFATFAAWTFPMGASLAFHIGLVTTLFGFLALILGLLILGDSCLNLLDQVHYETRIPKDLPSKYHVKLDDGATKATMTLLKVVARITVAVITMFSLLCLIHTGYRLATEPRKDSKYYFLTTSIGVLSITFGFTYFLIGLAVILELALNLLQHLQKKEKRGNGSHQGCDTEDKSFV